MSTVSNSDSRNSGNAKSVNRQAPSRLDHTPSVFSSTDPVSNGAHHMKNSSYEERYNFAINAGMSPERARLYASYQNSNTYENTFWDKARVFFGGKSGYDKRQEELDTLDQGYFNELLNADYNEKYNSAEQVADRQRKAGMNPDLAPGSIEAGQASEVDDAVISNEASASNLLGVQSAGDPGPSLANVIAPVEQVMTALGSVFSMVSTGVGITRDIFDMDVDSIRSAFEFSKLAGELGDYLPTLGLSYNDTVNSYQNAEGEFMGVEDIQKLIDKDILQRMYGIRGRRAYGIVKATASGLRSPENINKHLESLKNNLTTQNDIIKASTEQAQYTGEAGDTIGLHNDIRSLFVDNDGNLTFGDYVTKTASIFAETQDYNLELAKYNADYQKAVNDYYVKYGDSEYSRAELQAMQEGLVLKSNALVSEASVKVHEQMRDLTNQIIHDATVEKKPLSYLLLMSMMSGTFRQNGFGDPYDLVQKSAEEAIKAFGDFTSFLGKGAIGKGFTKKAGRSARKAGKSAK